MVVLERQRHTLDPAMPTGVRHAVQQFVEQSVASLRRAFERVARFPQCCEKTNRTCRRIEPDAVADAPVTVGIVGKDDGDAPFRRQFGNRSPVPRQASDEAEAVGDRLRSDDVALGPLVPLPCRLERDGPREDAPIELGQGHVHRQVAPTQSPSGLAPHLLGRTGERHLQHGRHPAIEYGRDMPFAGL